jgi:hypothetical protein
MNKVLLTALILNLSFLSKASASAGQKEPAKAEATSKDALSVNPYGKYFTSSEKDITVEMVLIDGKNEDGLQDALLKITGAEAHNEGIDGKVLRYKAVPAGTGTNFNYQKNGKEATRMLSRDSWGSWKNFELFVNGKSFKVYGDSAKSKEVKPSQLASEFKSQQK